jgi:hypothetical protein
MTISDACPALHCSSSVLYVVDDALAFSNALVPAAARYLALLSVFRFCARRAQKRNTEEDKVPL